MTVWQVAKMCKKQVTIHNDNEILWYYQGDTLHCKVNLLDRKPGYLMFPHVDSIFRINNQKFIKITSTVVSVEPWKIRVSTVLLMLKNHIFHIPNHPQTQENPTLSRNQPNSPSSTKIKYSQIIQNHPHLNLSNSL